CQIVDGLLPLPRGLKAALLGHDGEGEKSTPVGDETREQEGRRQCVDLWVPHCECQRHGGVNEKIECDIEKSTAISALRSPRNGAVQTISDPACDEQCQCDVKSSKRGGERRREPQQASHDGDGVCSDSDCCEQSPPAREERINQPPNVGIDHGLYLLRRSHRELLTCARQAVACQVLRMATAKRS